MAERAAAELEMERLKENLEREEASKKGLESQVRASGDIYIYI